MLNYYSSNDLITIQKQLKLHTQLDIWDKREEERDTNTFVHNFIQYYELMQVKYYTHHTQLSK